MPTRGWLSAIALTLLTTGAGLNARNTMNTQPNPGQTTAGILLTSAGGAKLESCANIAFQSGTAPGNILTVIPAHRKQTIDGIGSSFTESSAFVLAHLDLFTRRQVMRSIYSQDGANFSLTRTHIGACDFTVNGRYSYDDNPGDTDLSHFSIKPDKTGFDPITYPGIRDASYDLIPMIREALAIKREQADSTLHIVASAWTAPSWMKDIDDWYIPGTPQNNYQGTGGRLKSGNEPLYADYLVKYLQAYRNEGIRVWGMTPVNEPYGVNGQWESMAFDPDSENLFVKTYLGPKLRKARLKSVNVLAYDQNRDGVEAWTDVMFADHKTSGYLYGVAVHWYESTNRVYEEKLDRIHAKYPDKAIIHTEGCIDNLGGDAPGGVLDPAGFKESGWFDNDSFWWGPNATDWAYSVTWQGVDAKDHPAYAPVHRYARSIIEGIDHWMNGWIDWNVVLDRNGGPNHVNNFCGAPIMIDTTTQEVYYTPVYYILAQFSRTIRPGDQAVETHFVTPGHKSDDLHACATINADNLLSVQVLNTTNEPVVYHLQIGSTFAPVTIPANAVQTVRVQL
jgi:glucosylceramidase